MIYNNPLIVKSIRWDAESAVAGNNAVVQDSNGKVLWSSTASGANYTEEAILETMWSNGFKVPTLDAGILYITVW